MLSQYNRRHPFRQIFVIKSPPQQESVVRDSIILRGPDDLIPVPPPADRSDLCFSLALLKTFRGLTQIYLSVTRKTSSTNRSQSDCIILHCLISKFWRCLIWPLGSQAGRNSEVNILLSQSLDGDFLSYQFAAESPKENLIWAQPPQTHSGFAIKG